MHRYLAKSIANWKVLSNFILVYFFQISGQPSRIRKNRDHQKLLLKQGYLSKVKLQFSKFPYKQFYRTWCIFWREFLWEEAWSLWPLPGYTYVLQYFLNKHFQRTWVFLWQTFLIASINCIQFCSKFCSQYCSHSHHWSCNQKCVGLLFSSI